MGVGGQHIALIRFIAWIAISQWFDIMRKMWFSHSCRRPTGPAALQLLPNFRDPPCFCLSGCVCVLATSLLRGPAKVQLEEVPPHDVPFLSPVVKYLTVSQSYEPSIRRATLDTHSHRQSSHWHSPLTHPVCFVITHVITLKQRCKQSNLLTPPIPARQLRAEPKVTSALPVLTLTLAN